MHCRGQKDRICKALIGIILNTVYIIPHIILQIIKMTNAMYRVS